MPPRLEEAMLEILGGDGARSEIAANARRLANESFSIEALIMKPEDVYRLVEGYGL